MNKRSRGKIIELSILAVALCLVLGIKFFDHLYNSSGQEDPSEQTELAVPIEPKEEVVAVHVAGEVIFPDVYEVPKDARIKDVIDLAGGFTSEADERSVNMALRVYDTQQIIVYKVGEAPDPAAENPIGAWTLADLNEADRDRLMEIKGIGESMADKIIAYREEKGPFNSVDELSGVSGIGDKKLESIKEVFESSLKK